MALTGKCLCGAVRYTVEKEITEVGACHCAMCRAWSGGVFIGLAVSGDQARIEGEAHLTVFSSSEWAERGFCSRCGSCLFYRVTAPGPAQGQLHFGAGTLDDWGDIRLTEEIFIDRKPPGYAFAGEHKTMTEEEVFAMFAPPGD